MFTKATHAEIEELADFAWEIQSNIETASYPTDAYKSKQDVIDTMHKYLNTNPKHPDDTVLVLRDDNKPVAVVILDVESENLYLKTTGIFASSNFQHVHNELKLWCCRSFKGFNLYIGLPRENNRSCKAAMEIGGIPIEDSDVLRLYSDDFVPIESDADIRLLSLDYYDEFAAFIDKADKDIPPDEMYWNAERIREQFDIWRIYTLHIDGEIAGCATFINTPSMKEFGEIFRFCTTSKNLPTNALRALLTKGVPPEFADGRKYIVYFVEIKDAMEREAAVQTGFKQVGSYICYKILCV